MYNKTKNERESDSKSLSNPLTRRSNVIKRLLVLLMITMSLVFAGAQSTPNAQASRFCDLVCGEPFIDPNDGQCKQMCCPADESCK
ncbi:MAG TPA: hypothetical protein VFO63_02525, partial [Blastocatellia bacterium]|nr:hypothetical protein [Blastocatellia bacterium]